MLGNLGKNGRIGHFLERTDRVKRPRVGIGILVIKDEELLLGKRQGIHGNREWAPPGGHLEFGESIEDCARRELLEETGIQITNLKYGPFSNDIFVDEDKHYVSLFVIAEYLSGSVELKEPDKCSEWKWFCKGDLPEPLFLPLRNVFAQGFSL